MTDIPPRNPARVPPDPAGPRPLAGPPSAVLDAHGFDPHEFEWRPVPRRPRADGWTPDVQRLFIQALAKTGVVERACEAAGMSVGSAYRLRHAPGGEGFDRAWRAALRAAADRLHDLCFERAIAGVDEPVFDRDGIRVGAKWRFDHRLATFLLRAYFPERFRHATRDTRAPHEPLPPDEPPVAEAVARLAPVVPAEPHRLVPPDALADMIDTARACAEVEEMYPVDEREPYRHVAVEEPHPASLSRREQRRRRDAARAERATLRRARENASPSPLLSRGSWDGTGAEDMRSASPSPLLPEKGGEDGLAQETRNASP